MSGDLAEASRDCWRLLDRDNIFIFVYDIWVEISNIVFNNNICHFYSSLVDIAKRVKCKFQDDIRLDIVDNPTDTSP